MSLRKTNVSRYEIKDAKGRPGVHTLGLGSGDALQIVRRVRAGISFRHVVRFEKVSGLSRETIARFAAIPQRTLTRRQSEGKLQPGESDRMLRASRIFDLAVDLFEGDVAAVRQWLQTPQAGLRGEVPLEFASTEVGAREVEKLIGRLEHGVVA